MKKRIKRSSAEQLPLLVDGNPIESNRNIRNVKYVVADGKMYDCAELWRSVGFKS
jgi:hypothetical protein